MRCLASRYALNLAFSSLAHDKNETEVNANNIVMLINLCRRCDYAIMTMIMDGKTGKSR